jgi:hypothetical protein
MGRTMYNRNDYIDKKIGKLTILNWFKEDVNIGNHKTRKFFNCICDCGNKCKIYASLIFNNHTTTCGCSPISKTRKILETPGTEIGKIFKRLTITSFTGYKMDKYGKRRAHFLCKCSCGQEIEVPFTQLKSNAIQSCGCLDKETRQNRAIQNSIKNTLPDNESCQNELFGSYNKSASIRKFSFNLTKEEFISLVEKDCFYCGQHPSSIQKNSRKNPIKYYYNGIDRVDNNLGYTIDNSVPCCIFCNTAKHHHSQEEFFKRVEKIYNKHFNNENR